MKCAAIIVGIENWQRFTKPLMDSLFAHEPDVLQVVIDNASAEPYPILPEVWRTERLCYSAAINRGKTQADRIYGPSDWYIVLSNDVLCTGPFAHILEGYSDAVVGPLIKNVQGFDYVEGWCVATPKNVWDAVGGWDEKFIGSSWEDVSFSTDARLKGFELVEDLPFIHLDQRQRFTVIPDYWSTENANIAYFREKYKDVRL